MRKTALILVVVHILSVFISMNVHGITFAHADHHGHGHVHDFHELGHQNSFQLSTPDLSSHDEVPHLHLLFEIPADQLEHSFAVPVKPIPVKLVSSRNFLTYTPPVPPPDAH